MTSRLTDFIIATQRVHPAYSIAIVAAFSVGIFVILSVFRSAVTSLGRWGYLAAFAINALSASSVFLPAPGLAAIIVLTRDYHPFWLGVAAGIGGALGELVAYWLGLHGGRAIEGKRLHEFLVRHMSRHGSLVLLGFSMIPFMPVDVAGILAGATRYPVHKFLIYVAIGKTVQMIGVMYAAAWSIDWAEPWLERIF